MPHVASVVVVDVDLAGCRLVLRVASELSTLDALAPREALFGVNGGYFDGAERPIGWRRVDGREVSAPWIEAKGGVLAIADRNVYVGPRGGEPVDAETIVQAKPLLVERDGRSGIHRDDGLRAARTVACETASGIRFVMFFASLHDGPTLAETAEALRRREADGGYGCLRALNLDGGPSTGVYFGSAIGLPSVPPRGRITDALFAVPR